MKITASLLVLPRVPSALVAPYGQRPNPAGWKGGSEDYDTVWTLHGHKADGLALHFDVDADADREMGVTPSSPVGVDPDD